MEQMAISKFKATCLAVLERVRKTRRGILVTRRGEPVARVVPPDPAPAPKGSAFGCLAGTAEEVADIVEPLSPEEWEALR
jgi:prevent-host-death family protein